MGRLLLAVMAALLPGMALAQTPLRLKVASGVASTHYLEVQGSQYWMKQVTDASGGRIQFDYYPGEQLGKVDKMMELAQAGVVDIAAQSMAYTSDKTPLSGVIELPGLVKTSCQGTDAYLAATQPGKAIYDSDFKGQRIRPLFDIVLAQFKLLTSQKPVRDLADFAGLKLRTAGGVGAIVTTALGAVPVHVTTPDVYQSFSRGTLDGVWLQFAGAKSYDLQTVAKYGTYDFGFGSIPYVWVISDRSWARIPPDLQAILKTAGRTTEQHLCQWIDQDEETARQSLAAGGMAMIALSPAAQQAIGARVAPVAAEWAKDLDGRGRPGTAALKDFSTALAAEPARP